MLLGVHLSDFQNQVQGQVRQLVGDRLCLLQLSSEAPWWALQPQSCITRDYRSLQSFFACSLLLSLSASQPGAS